MSRDPGKLSAAFRRGLAPHSVELIRLSPGDLEVRLAAILSRGQEAWPKLAIDAEGWMIFLAKRLDPADALTTSGFPHAEDLFLAYACVVGTPGAMQAFERTHFGKLPSHLAQLTPTTDFLKDVEQTLRAKLFVAEAGKEMGIAAYSGRGPLGAWFRVTALNTALKLLRSEMKQQPREAQTSAYRPQTDPERDLIRARTRTEMEETLRQVLAQAPARERALLRMHFVEGSTFEELAQVFDVGRRTAVRWVRDARQSILRETQRRMVERLKLSPSDLSSTFRMTRSDWTLSLEALVAVEKK